ncbi:probable inactive receptor kinase at4g23740 [Phtheirospermum japonicum]|uniref:Probable inactive receptor kinase at4g23740 n=1 Tax=Phtheirospermum japonicum TaxID=374723 RepID=A0A830BL97_9LAMI|nr:probable inactive receptor kinase at4g23740 [Phtheirospermum japonicum]
MSAIYDNWERLVDAVLKKQQLWQLFHDHSRSSSILSEASDFSSSFNSRSPLDDLAFDFAKLGKSSWSQRVHPKLVLISDFSPAIDVKCLYLASSEILGIGISGTTYAVTMDNGVRIVVKRLRLISISEQDFKRHMDIVGNVRHENVAALRAYYSSKDERLMLYDYYCKGSVYALLHGVFNSATSIGRNRKPRADVDWESRLKIAIGAARGIAEIHKHNGGKLVHGNIIASNVFLNRDMYGCISDLGLTNLIATNKSTLTAHCYAPEVKNTQNVSQASDVYSFGILLLELLTRKSPAYVPCGPKPVNLVKLVTSVINRIRAANVFDADLLKHPTIKEQMVKMFQIGMRCVEKSVIKRPKMSEVVMLLEEITMLNPKSQITPVKRKLVFFENANPAFDLDEMLKASAEVLGKGTFGTTYKATFEDGSSVVVKRLKDVIATYEEFQQHMEITGRMRHKNINGLRAYYFSRDETLLLYDYHNQDSVSALLHVVAILEGTTTGRGKTLSKWETRLNIAVGAARGIAHIHLQDDRKFLHGNIKSSNIFLYTQKYSIVSDAGLAKLSRPITRSHMPTPGYCAPEVKDTANVSQASDVYSFGVVLLELLSGKPNQITKDDGDVISLVDWIQSVVVREEWMTKVFDLEIPRHAYMEEAMVQVLQIAMDCVRVVPEGRPRMSEVVKMLEDISGVEPETGVEDTWEQPLESRLESLLDDLLPTL